MRKYIPALFLAAVALTLLFSQVAMAKIDP
jgi:hypothetical protein